MAVPSASLPPPRPRRMKARYQVTDESMRISYGRKQWFLIGFLLLWLTGWTVGCVALAVALFVRQELFVLIFGLPFWASWLFVASVLLGMLFGREELAVEGDELRYGSRVIVPLKQRVLPLPELRCFRVGVKPAKSDESPPESCLEIVTIGKPLSLFAGLPEAELRWLVDQLNQLLPASIVQQSGDESPSDDEESEAEVLPDERGSGSSRAADDEAGRRILTDEPLPTKAVRPPSDSDWQYRDQYNGLHFINRGRWNWGSVLGLLFINCFWNGIVGVFVMVLLGKMPGNGPQGWERVGLAVFLIPFEVIGLAMFAALLLTMAEPVRRLTWRFGEREIQCRLAWLGLGRDWTYPVDRVGRLEIQEREKDSRGQMIQSNFQSRRIGPHDDGDWEHKLVFIDRDNLEICTINQLTLGEAEWIADRLRRARPRWFR